MDETRPSDTKPEKLVRRSVVIALGIICLVLTAPFAYLTVTGISAQNNYDNLQNQNRQLQTWLYVNKTMLDQEQINNTNLQTQNMNPTNQVIELTRTLKLEKSSVCVNNETISQSADSYTDFSYLVVYSGYVSLNVASSTTNTTYAEVIYSDPAYGINYDKTMTLGTRGTAAFPVFGAPTSFPTRPINMTAYTTLEIRIGNTNTVGNATETVTETYYY